MGLKGLTPNFGVLMVNPQFVHWKSGRKGLSLVRKSLTYRIGLLSACVSSSCWLCYYSNHIILEWWLSRRNLSLSPQPDLQSTKNDSLVCSLLTHDDKTIIIMMMMTYKQDLCSETHAYVYLKKNVYKEIIIILV